MHFTWESNTARRISRLTRCLHSTTHSRVQVFSFTCKLITCNLTICVGKKLGNTTNIFSSVFRAATTLRITRHLFAYMFGITNCMQICTRGNTSQWNTDTLRTASFCSIAYIRSNKDDQIANTLWWEPVSLIKNTLWWEPVSLIKNTLWWEPVSLIKNTLWWDPVSLIKNTLWWEPVSLIKNTLWWEPVSLIKNTLWWEPVSLIKNINAKGSDLSRKRCSALRSWPNRKVLAENLLPTRFGCQHKLPW